MLAFRVDDVGHLLGRREILGRKRLAQLREEAPLGSRHALPLRGDEPRGTQRFEQQRQQLIVGCLQRFRELAGEQQFNLRAGDVAPEEADAVDVFGQQVELPVGKARREVLRRGVETRAAAVDGAALLGLRLQGGFALPGLLQLLLPLPREAGNLRNGALHLVEPGVEVVPNRGRVAVVEVREGLVDAPLFVAREIAVGQPTFVVAVLLVEVAAGLRTGESAALDLTLQIVERKAGIPEEDDAEGESAEEYDQRVEDRRRHHPDPAQQPAPTHEPHAHAPDPCADPAVGATVRVADVFDAVHGRSV